MSSACVSPDAERLIHYARVSLIPHVIVAAIDAGIFETLASGPHTAPALAAELKVSHSALERFLIALCALGLAERRGRSYHASQAAQQYLCADSPCFLGDMFRHSLTLCDQWSRIGEAVKTGEMPPPPESRLRSYADQLGTFLKSMHGAGMIQSAKVLKMIDLKNTDALLDLGGGLGTYAVAAVQRCGCARATVYDLPDVVEHAREFICNEGVLDRVRVHAGQCLCDPLPPGPFDCVVISQLLHMYCEKDCRSIVKKACRVLRDTGVLAVHDYAGGCGDDLSVSLVDMTMLTGTPQGMCHTASDIHGWMEASGIDDIQTAPVPGGSTVLWGNRKGSPGYD